MAMYRIIQRSKQGLLIELPRRKARQGIYLAVAQSESQVVDLLQQYLPAFWQHGVNEVKGSNAAVLYCLRDQWSGYQLVSMVAQGGSSGQGALALSAVAYWCGSNYGMLSKLCNLIEHQLLETIGLNPFLY